MASELEEQMHRAKMYLALANVSGPHSPTETALITVLINLIAVMEAHLAA